MKRLAPFLIPLLGLASGLLVACGDDPAAPAPDPPAFPAGTAFAFDVSFFQDNYVPPSLAGGVLRAAHGGHFGFAALRAMENGIFLEGRLRTQEGLFAAARETEPAYRDGAHVWDLVLPAPADDPVRLEAYAAGDEVRWIGRRDTGEGFRDWFFAAVDTGGLAGSWVLHDPFPADAPVLVEIAWAGTAGETGARTLGFRWPEGHELTLEADGYVHDLQWSPAAGDEPWRVNWNAESQEGWLVAPDYWNGTKVCWDWHLDDTSCLGVPGS